MLLRVFRWLGGLWRRIRHGRGFGVDELAARLGTTTAELRAIVPTYRERHIPKRSGGERVLHVPADDLKELQRRILHRLFKKLRTHPSAVGFERGRSIVDAAKPHVGQAVVVKLDVKDFFPRTGASRILQYFRAIGWNRSAAALLVRLCTHLGGLPQGAPTSPRLSNLVNFLFDRRLAGLARKLQARYTRYADDLTFSFAVDDRDAVRGLVKVVRRILRQSGYQAHPDKLRILRRHQQQRVTGLVVNEGVRLPRRTRRWLRAVEHHSRTGRPTTLTREQLAGWAAFRSMVEMQVAPAKARPPLIGVWLGESMRYDGRDFKIVRDATARMYLEWTFTTTELRSVRGDHEESGGYTIDGTTDPPGITVVPRDGPHAGTPIRGILRREGGRLEVCLGPPGGERPNEFTADAGSRRTLFRLAALVGPAGQ